MEIRNVLSSVYKADDKFREPSGKTPETTQKVKIEISKQGKALQNTGETKSLADIQKKTDSGFYNSDRVISKVADAILKEIGK